jgi:hypothetical protein
MPALTVPTGDALRLDLPLPMPYHGRVTVDTDATTPEIAVPSALVRAFVYLKDDKLLPRFEDGAVGIQVAETRTDDDGNFVLLVPRKLGVDD